MSMREAFQKSLRQQAHKASIPNSPDELSAMGEEWFQLRSSDSSDPLAIRLLRQRFGSIDFPGQEPDVRERFLYGFAQGLHVFNDMDPRFETVGTLRGRTREIFPEELFRSHQQFIALLEMPFYITTGAAVLVGAAMDLSFGSKDVRRLESLVVSATYRSKIKLSHAVPLVSEWLDTR